MSSILYTLLALSSLTSAIPTISHIRSRSTAPGPIATTLNGSYYGTHSTTYNEDLFLGIPFAEPPLQDLRFANPKSLNSSWTGALPATNYAWNCIGYGADQIGYEQSEDCLYLNVVRPSGYENTTLPVAVWIHGGGFSQGGAPDRRYNLSFIVANSVSINKPIIAVSIAYRLGPIGFLNGDAIEKAGAQNLGLKDQRLALHWIRENIAGFGGDKEKVTIWGESAGAASVGFHITAFNGRDDHLFRGAIMESGNPIYYGGLANSSGFQTIYDSLVKAAGCEEGEDSLQCLKELPFFVLNNILNTTAFNSGWGPAFDGDFVARYGSEQLADGSFVHVPIIDGANSDEGTAFGSRGVDTRADLVKAVRSRANFSTVPDSLIQQLTDVYSAPEYLIPSNESLGGDVTLSLPYGAYYRHGAAYAGDNAFIASRRLTCEVWSNASLPAYSYRFNAIPAGISWPTQVTHFQEVAFVFNNLNGLGYAVNPFQNKSESYTKLSEVMSKSWASFVYDLSPNGWGESGRNGVEEWRPYSDGGYNMVWDANVTSYMEKDDFRAEGMKLMNDNWGLFQR